MFYKTILVLTDNLVMAREFQHIYENLAYRTNLVFAVSPPSDKNEFERVLQLPVQKIDLKNKESIASIKSEFGLVISMHCKQLFPADLVNSVKCINVHPGLNPYTRGWYPQVFAIVNNLAVGATIHEMDEHLDHGRIIARKEVPKEYTDTSFTLYNKILKAEVDLLTIHLLSILKNTYTAYPPETEGVLHQKKDFKELCEIRLDEETTYLKLINRLRALTHGDFNNAYFVNPQNGKKVYIKINLIEEDEW